MSISQEDIDAIIKATRAITRKLFPAEEKLFEEKTIRAAPRKSAPIVPGATSSPFGPQDVLFITQVATPWLGVALALASVLIARAASRQGKANDPRAILIDELIKRGINSEDAERVADEDAIIAIITSE